MKKAIIIPLLLLIVLSLSACQDKPFEPNEDGFTYEEVTSISYSYDTGLEIKEMFSYDFSHAVKLFSNEDGSILNFKNINDYKMISEEINALISTYEDTVQYRTVQESNFDDSFDLSLGATEDDYNYETVEHDGEVFTEDAFLVTERGLSIIVSYTRFDVDGVEYKIPSYIQFIVNSIHVSYAWEFLGSDNDYYDTDAKLIHYDEWIVPLPMKTGVLSSFETLLDSDSFYIDNHTRVVADSTGGSGVWQTCSEEVTTNCMSPTYATLTIQIYDMVVSDVYAFYEDNFGGLSTSLGFVFTLDGHTYLISDLEEVQVYDDYGSIIDVVNASISVVTETSQ
jgi:hypothetical protein